VYSSPAGAVRAVAAAASLRRPETAKPKPSRSISGSCTAAPMFRSTSASARRTDVKR
jgi:hypothetical protein